jgi:hypothetical protein
MPQSHHPLPRPAAALRGVWLVALALSLTTSVWIGATRSATASRPTRPSVTPIQPLPSLPDPVHLPVLDFLGDRALCASWVSVQNVGGEAGKALAVVWGDDTRCAPACVGPLAVACSGLLSPGQSWLFGAGALPADARSAVVFSFNARSLGEGGVPGWDGTVADFLCAALARDVVGSCDRYQRFKAAFEAGTVYAGVTLTRAYGPALAAQVLRQCPGNHNKVAPASSTYEGIAGRGFGGRDQILNVSSYHAPLVACDGAGADTVLYIQNGGSSCASADVWLSSESDCGGARLCSVFTFDQGTTVTFAASSCVPPDWRGTAWIRSSELLAVAVDVVRDNALLTYTAVPSELRHTWDGPPEFTAGSPVVYGPLILDPARGWANVIHVQNLSSVTRARVRVTFLDRAGAPIAEPIEEWVCPRGVHAFALPAGAGDPQRPAGSVRVESISWEHDPRGRPIRPPNISALATLSRLGELDPTGDVGADARGALAYNLLPEPLAFTWPSGPDPGTGLIAVPAAFKGAEPTGATTEIAIANLVPAPGFTDIAVFVFDANGLVDLVCHKLREQEVGYLDLATWGFLAPGFQGAAIVSAAFWEHDGGDRRGSNLLGLAAVAVQRAPVALGQDLGDGLTATAGTPFRSSAASPAFDPGRLVVQCLPPPVPTPTAVALTPGRTFLPWSIRSRGP